MILEIIKKITIFCVIFLSDLALIKNLPAPWNLISIITVSLIFWGVVYNFKIAMIYALLFGLILDITTPFFFGINILTLLLTVKLTEIIYHRFITNRSLYSILVLLLFALVARQMIYSFFMGWWFLVVEKNVVFNHLFNYETLISGGWMILFNGIIAIILFLIFYFFSNRFKAVLTR